MTESQADRHDLDKLSRWHRDLTAYATSEAQGRSPVFALFLVTSEDLDAHAVFRQFRSSFEQRGAGFEHLIIFGQHGMSSTVLRLMIELDLPQEKLPIMGMFSGSSTATIHILSLSKGSISGRHGESRRPGAESGADQSWREALNWLEAGLDGEGKDLDLAAVPGTYAISLRNNSVNELVAQVFQALS